MRQKFNTAINRTTALAVAVGFLILFLSFGLPLILTPTADLKAHGMPILLSALFLFFLYVLLSSLRKFLISFVLANKVLEIHLPPWHVKTIAYDQIKGLTLLDAEQAKERYYSSMMEQESLKENADLVGFIRMLRQKSPAYKYLSTAPTARVTTTGERETIQSLKVKAPCGLVVLELKDGQKLFLSPWDMEEFAAALTARLE